MAEQIINITPGSGQKLHSFERVIGANTVQDEVVVAGEQYLASYGVAAGPTVATLNQHVLQIMAGASLKVRIRRIALFPSGSTVATNGAFSVIRLTTAGTGGTAITPTPFDPADAASGATAMSNVVTPGTEGAAFHRVALPFTAAAPQPIGYYEWRENPNQKPLIIAAGTANGIAIKCLIAVTAGAMQMIVEFDESNF